MKMQTRWMQNFVLLQIWSFTVVSVNSWTLQYDPDGDLTLNELVKKLGYDGIESHYATTSDGYIVNIQHIKRNNSENLTPILFIHGLSACADSFFVKKEQSGPIILANNGYDVWLLNSRGTTESSNHTSLNPDNDKEFWFFSWEEIGLYDLPMAIDVVLNHTVHEKVILIGHSEGSTIIFVTLSERPEYNDKVSLSMHWAASVYHKDCSSVRFVSALCRFFEPIFPEVTEFLGLYANRPLQNFREMMKQLCRYTIFKQTCFEGAKLLLQSSEVQIEHVDDWSFYIGKALCGGSMREAQHYMQVGLTGRFARFNHGPQKNLELYNSTEPPLFPLENVRSPVVLWCGMRDIFCTEDDITKLRSQLVNAEKITYFEGHRLFTHIDFLVAKDVDKYFYKEMLVLLKIYSNKN